MALMALGQQFVGRSPARAQWRLNPRAHRSPFHGPFGAFTRAVGTHTHVEEMLSVWNRSLDNASLS